MKNTVTYLKTKTMKMTKVQEKEYHLRALNINASIIIFVFSQSDNYAFNTQEIWAIILVIAIIVIHC